ncbi:hypothetical protein [Acidithiobacillus sp.]|uniref:hypothetical protein n=1 Tax=Acidithiobacillus sp. TaxID=1872118 RepID=UPI003CFED949
MLLEHLRHIRGRVNQIADDVTDLKLRMTSVEQGMGLINREIRFADEVDARR